MFASSKTLSQKCFYWIDNFFVYVSLPNLEFIEASDLILILKLEWRLRACLLVGYQKSDTCWNLIRRHKTVKCESTIFESNMTVFDSIRCEIKETGAPSFSEVNETFLYQTATPLKLNDDSSRAGAFHSIIQWVYFPFVKENVIMWHFLARTW